MIFIQDEFVGCVLFLGFEDFFLQMLEEFFSCICVGVKWSVELYIMVCNIMDWFVKCFEGVVVDYVWVVLIFMFLIEVSVDIYVIDINEIFLLNDGF